MRFIYFTLGLTLLLPSGARAAVPDHAAATWRNPDGSPALESPSRKSRKGFGGMLIISPDENIRKKWETPPETIPKLEAVSAPIPKGKKIFILAFFSNPKLSKAGIPNVRCDFKLVKPDGAVALDQKDMPCSDERPMTEPKLLYMANRSIGFVGDPPDPVGKWLVSVSLVDKLRDVRLNLESSFELK